MSKVVRTVIRPQPGPQENFLSSSADIVIYGGAAGSGKSWGVLMEPLRHVTTNREFAAVFFRKNTTHIRNPGGLWDESMKLYPSAGGKPSASILEWRWPAGGKVKMGHLEHEDSVLDWQGAQIPLIIFDELTHFCLTEDHQVLTENGWKPIAAVVKGEKAVSYSAERKLELKDVLDTPSFDFDGKLIEVDQRNGVSFAVTPNHKMPVNKQDKVRTWKFIEAKHLLEAGQVIPRFGEWEETVEPEWFELPVACGQGLGANSNVADRVRMDDWLEFLGWYFSEGSSFYTNCGQKNPTGQCVSISQVKVSQNLEDLMTRLPWRFIRDNSEYKPGKRKNSYKIFSKQLFDLVHPFGNLYEKRIPRWIFKLSKRQQRIFFDAFVKGDGHVSADGRVAIGLANSGLIDDLQEMCVYLGLVGTRNTFVPKHGFTVHSLAVSAKGRNTQTKPQDAKEVPFSGKVYCLTVKDNHTFMIRRNGRISWTGNSENQFFYMLSRNRSMSGVKPYVRATCNPDADSWVASFIEWWIDQESGYPIIDRSGVMRWFIRLGDNIVWADSRSELVEKYGKPNLPADHEDQVRPKSVTFVPAKLSDNKALTAADPDYKANLMALSRVERERLLHGNWKIRPASGLYFKRSEITIVDNYPDDIEKFVRGWDLAATEPNEDNKDPDATAGVLFGRRKNGRYIILDCVWEQKRSHNIRELVKRVAQNDSRRVTIRLSQDPGQAGKDQIESYVSHLAGFSVVAVRESGDKIIRKDAYAAQWQAGNIDLLRGQWNEAFLIEHEAFGGGKGHDDRVDAADNAFTELTGSNLSVWSRLGRG